MKKAILCCISCILPCGSLDVIRIVHANGRVEEISGSVKACEVMKAYPKHVLKKPTSTSSSNEWIELDDISCEKKMPRIVILPPDAQLERGKIYFLTPLPVPSPSKKSSARKRQSQQQGTTGLKSEKHQMRSGSDPAKHLGVLNTEVLVESKDQMSLSLLSSASSDQYLSELLSEEKLSNQRERRRGRVGVWRPHLHSISESDSPPSEY